MTCSCEKRAVSIGMARGVGVAVAVKSIRVLIAVSDVVYLDVMSPAKSRPVGVTSVHGVLLVSVLCQLLRIISLDVEQSKKKCFAG